MSLKGDLSVSMLRFEQFQITRKNSIDRITDLEKEIVTIHHEEQKEAGEEVSCKNETVKITFTNHLRFSVAMLQCRVKEFI